MKILLAHNSLYFPSHGGGDKSNRLLMQAMASHGHTVQVMARLESFSDAEHARFLEELAERETPVDSIRDGVVAFTRNAVQVYTVTNNPRLRLAFAARVEEFDPDVILCSTDDPGALLLEVALRSTRARVAYLVRATVAVPFGPDSASANATKTEMLGRVDSIIGVSEYVAKYVREHSGLPAIHVPISLLDPGDYSDMGRFDNEFVLMVNPCAVKGISIFTALAQAMPDVTFAAVPTWGTNPDDIAQLRGHANIRLFEPIDDIAVLLRRTRVVLVPSVWAEARSRMVVESMIRGIPVMASDVGGLHEAKLGVEYLLPVNPILRYHARVDTNMVPVAEVPPQDIGVWQSALTKLTRDRAHYEDVSRRSRAAALAYAEMLHSGWLERHLEELIRQPKRLAPAPTTLPASALEKLSPAKRRLLAVRLRNTRTTSPAGSFFPDSFPDQSDKPILFCLPWAGGGTSVYRAWVEPLADVAEVCPIRLPGRESRIGEAPFREMSALVEALRDAVRPYVDRDYAFYGHSMGAGVAFELTRSLRRNRMPMPRLLIAAAARAPQLRTQSSGVEPDDEELLDQLNRMGALPANPEVLKIVLPALRADAFLYRHYVYAPEPPLSIALHAIRGVEDTAVTTQQVADWSAQTTAEFSFTELPGGHLFPRTHPETTLQFVRGKLLF